MNQLKSAITREGIARKVRELRVGRGLSQAELSKRLGLSQGRYSVIERGGGSLSAEQLLEVLRFFNVPASEFYAASDDIGGEIQNALARLGAQHLYENKNLLPSERLQQVEGLILEVLVTADTPRQLTALAPVLLRNIDSLNLTGQWARCAQLGIERRLGWTLENTLEAVRRLLVVVGPGREGSSFRRLAAVLTLFLSRGEVRRAVPGAGPDTGVDAVNDVVGVKVLNPKTIRDLWKSASEISRRWLVISSLQPDDFVQALEDAHAVSHR